MVRAPRSRVSQITLPIELRRKYDIATGDDPVGVGEDERGGDRTRGLGRRGDSGATVAVGAGAGVGVALARVGIAVALGGAVGVSRTVGGAISTLAARSA